MGLFERIAEEWPGSPPPHRQRALLGVCGASLVLQLGSLMLLLLEPHILYLVVAEI